MKTPSRLDQISQRLAAATPGPWTLLCAFGSWDLPSDIVKETGRTKIIEGVECDDNDSICEVSADAKNPSPDMRLIAHAPDDITYLINRVRRLEAALERVASNYGMYDTGMLEDIARQALGEE